MHLTYIDSRKSGLTRRRCGKGFCYLHPDGAVVKDRKAKARLQSLAIPPAWQDVWICPDPAGHLQATGRDERGRLQYRYHDAWRDQRDAEKFDKLTDFADVLPQLLRRMTRDLRQPHFSKSYVSALAVKLLRRTLIRVGHDEYARANESYGLTTFRKSHVAIDERTGAIAFSFSGKGGKAWSLSVQSVFLGRHLAAVATLPGRQLLQYSNADDAAPTRATVYSLTAPNVNAYLQDITGDEISAKDFRTWGGTVAAAEALAAAPQPASSRDRDKTILMALDHAAARLRNTRAVCRSSYVHPGLIECYEAGEFDRLFQSGLRQSRTGRGLPRTEAATHYVLKKLS